MMDKRGFTLIEILVALTVLVTVVTVVYSSFGAGVRAYRAQEARNYFRQNARQAWRGLSRDLRCSFALSASDGPTFTGQDQKDGEREHSRLQFITCLPATASTAGGLARVEYYVDTDPATPEQGLVRVDYGFPFARADTARERRVQIAPLVRSLKLEYFDGTSWEGEWGARRYADKKQVLPLSVRVTVGIAENETGTTAEIFSTVVPVFASRLTAYEY